ncbi:MAG TPA: 4-alpha-glucanotransferase [Nocardioidaceae bacterium]|nr:4-alpha-glucanotransferase [Nocardioidaceae bacterium]
MTELSKGLLDLASAKGVATEYTDWSGTVVGVGAETITAILSAMDVDVSTPQAAAEALDAHRGERWRRMVPPCVVMAQGASSSFWVHAGDGEAIEPWLELESGATVRDLPRLGQESSPGDVDGVPVHETTFRLPADLPLGYHRLHARAGGRQNSGSLIVTPEFVGLPERLGTGRTWGFAAQLYSVRSAGSWGVGDLVDLRDLAVWSGAELSAGFVLVNPLHAGEPVAPMEPSPYLPSSRRFVNPLYLRVEEIPEYAELPSAGRSRVDRLGEDVRRQLNLGDTIDRDTSWAAKRQALLLVHAVPRGAEREAEYRAFRAREGAGVVDFATWSAIAQVHGSDFATWPSQLQEPTSAAVSTMREQLADELEFHIWLQWVVDEQLQRTQADALAAGMSLGVMHDLAVGVHPGGADVWRSPRTFATAAHVGAPPDAFNQMGQDWSQPPWRPDRLEELSYAPLRDLIAPVLRHAGGVRVDHIIGLFRLWWIPAGQPPSAGTYVRYDHEAMIGVLALEAHRAGAVVVGEDLGVVEASARAYLLDRGILATSILWFERDEQGRPLPAERWREHCLASVTTHDLPPSAGYLAGEHVRLRDELGLLTRPLAEERAADEQERESWLGELRGRGLLTVDAGVEETVQALHRYLTLTPARLLCVALVDAVGDRRTQNQPGTTDEYPNWRVPLSGPDRKPVLLEDVMSSPRVVDLVRRVSDP